jgi:hypothetical protein
MTIDPKKIREVARVCATLSKSAPTAEEHDVFANLALKWLSITLDKETLGWQSIWTVSTTTVVHQVSVSPQKAQVLEDHLSGHGNRQTKGPREGGIRTHGTVTPVQRFPSSKVRRLAHVAQ